MFIALTTGYDVTSTKRAEREREKKTIVEKPMSLDIERGKFKQCDQMDSLIFRYLAVCKSDFGVKGSFLPKQLQNLAQKETSRHKPAKAF